MSERTKEFLFNLAMVALLVAILAVISMGLALIELEGF
jgi:hypothetical protein